MSASTFGWSDFLDVAVELVAGPRDALLEARERSAVSRAYYAAFRRAQEVVEAIDNFLPKRTGDDHDGVIFHLANAREARRKEVGTILRRLKAERRSADYDRVRHRLALPSSTVIAQARRALVLLDTLAAGT